MFDKVLNTLLQFILQKALDVCQIRGVGYLFTKIA